MKPLRRSLTFWLGVLGFVFLVWLWMDSFPRISYAEYEGEEGWIVLMSDKGVFHYTLRDLKGAGDFAVKISQPRPPRGFSITPEKVDLLSSDLLPRPLDINTDWHIGTRQVIEVQVAQWLVGIIYLLAWVAILLLRRRWWKAAEPLAGEDGPPV